MSRQMAETLRGLIDGKDDALADQLIPIAEHLEKAAEPTSIPIMTWSGALHIYTSLMEAGDPTSQTAAKEVLVELKKVCSLTDRLLEMNPSERLRLDLIRWMSWNDQNGVYTDEDCDNEDIPRLALEDGLSMVTAILEDN